MMFDQNKDGVVSEEEAKFFLHMEKEIEKAAFTTSWMLIKPYFLKEQTQFNAPPLPQTEELPNQDEIPHDSAEEHFPEEPEEEETAEEDEVSPSPVSQEYDADTQLLVDAANKAREAFKEVDQRVRDIGREIRQIEESSSKDYGLEEEFQPLEGKCFDYTDREYTYRLCLFDFGSQRPKHGGSETRLGSWGYWDGPAENKYSQMKYDKGVQCWNGPQRTLQVHLTCGMENELISVSEPNRCEYEFKFTTPAVCSEPVKPDEAADLHDEL